ncbi:MAG: AAA family ATPase [Lachnospiraceae bacterium]|nr:AAA family ATPase [Lachnospiraceae bacterium]
MNHNIVVNLGEQRFHKMIEENKFYIDKTDFIREWWEYGATVTLITRPRRFGKTLNMSMLECFFSNKYAGRDDLFQRFSIWKEEKYRQLQGTYPVIPLSFAAVKTGNMDGIKTCVKEMIANVYKNYKDIITSELFDEDDRKTFAAVQRKMDDDTACMALPNLCTYLSKYYGKDVIIILDEYDTPMQEAWLAGNWDKAVEFFRLLFNHTFKTNPHLHRGILTGITRISKESIFSGLNNLDVITTTSDEYAAAFGFTEEEVFAALDAAGLGCEKQKVKQWYNGFTFGKVTDIYNPWSLASFIGKNGEYKSYWANTSSNGLVNSLIQRGNSNIKQMMEDLLSGKSIVTELDEQVIFQQLNYNTEAVWSLLLATGYLKVINLELSGRFLRPKYTLALTNMEVESMFEKMIQDWFGGETMTTYNDFIYALLQDNVTKMNTFMNKMALHTFSSFDSGNKPSKQAEPERFYHGFVLGMVVNLADTCKIRSNRESGFGRYDVMLVPHDKNRKAFIFEFKVLDPDENETTLEDTLANAHAQIEEKQYETELISEGFSSENIRKYGFAFKGKTCLIG